MDYVADSYFNWSYHLDSKLSMYANNGIFFMERCYGSTLSSSGLDGDDLYVALKYLDLSTGINGEYPPKRNPCGGIRYNSYTGATREGENVVTEEEIENAIYKVF